jgi:hypothetical protein
MLLYFYTLFVTRLFSSSHASYSYLASNPIQGRRSPEGILITDTLALLPPHGHKAGSKYVLCLCTRCLGARWMVENLKSKHKQFEKQPLPAPLISPSEATVQLVQVPHPCRSATPTRTRHIWLPLHLLPRRSHCLPHAWNLWSHSDGS